MRPDGSSSGTGQRSSSRVLHVEHVIDNSWRAGSGQLCASRLSGVLEVSCWNLALHDHQWRANKQTDSGTRVGSFARPASLLAFVLIKKHGLSQGQNPCMYINHFNQNGHENQQWLRFESWESQAET